MRCATTLAVCAVASLTLGGCGIDEKRFDGVYRSGKALEAAVDSGVTLLHYRELIQAFDTEVSIVNDRARGRAEKELVDKYEAAAQSYHHALLVWRLKVDGESDWIYSGPTLDKALAEYTIKWEGSSDLKRASVEASLPIIWAVAKVKLATANDVLNGKK